MIGVNLVPSVRRKAKAQRAHLTRWVTGLLAYGLVLLAGYLVTVRYAAADSQPIDQESRKTSRQLENSGKAVVSLTQELGQAQKKLWTAQAVGQQPDWSHLMTLLSQNLDDTIVLNLCRLQKTKPAESPAKKGDAPDAAVHAQLGLELEGYAKAQSNVSEFVLRLEKLGLFDKVKLVKTTRQEYLKAQAVAFRLECTLTIQEGAPR